MKKLLFTLTLLSAAWGASAQNLYGDFETWHNLTAGFPPTTYQAPQGWYGVDSGLAPLYSLFTGGSKQYKPQVFKSTDFHGGAFSAKVMTRFQDSSLPLPVIPGAISNARFAVTLSGSSNVNIDYNGGTAVMGRVMNVKAWIKHIPKASDDSAYFSVVVVRAAPNGGGKTADTLIGTGEGYYGATPNYTQVTIPIEYDPGYPGIDPNKIVIIASSSDGGNPTDSTTLYLDDATMTVWANGIIEIPLFQQQIVKCYPNPSSGILNLQSDAAEKLTWEAYTSDGKLLSSQSFTGSTSVDLRGNAAAQYFFMVKNSSGKVLQTGNFNLQ